MKRRIAPLLTLLCLLVSLTGCDLLSPPPSSTPAAVSDGSTLAVHFIDVGQADSALLVCGDDTMLIDGGNVADSSLVVSYLEQQGIDQLDYVVCTHAHEDHVGGLSGPLNTCTVSHVLSPVTEYDSKAFGDFVKYTETQGLEPEIPAPGDTFALGEAQVTILGPVAEYSETNNTSIVLRVDFGETSFLFTGDMETKAEKDLLDRGADLSATVLKVGHHGSDTSSSYSFLREVMPEYAVISVGENNDYGHPNDDVLSRLSEVSTTDLAIPLGTLTGSALLAGRGPVFRVRMQFVGSSTARFENEFTEAGINQTKHRIILSVDVSVSILLPGVSTYTKVSNDFTVAETIIVGTVPDSYVYFHGNLEEAEDYVMNNAGP